MYNQPLVLNRDLDFNVEQRVALAAIYSAYVAIGALTTTFGASLHSSVAPLLTQAIGATVASLQCPYGSPPVDIVTDFDSAQNIFLHCNHSPRHCWSYGGRYITCPP